MLYISTHNERGLPLADVTDRCGGGCNGHPIVAYWVPPSKHIILSRHDAGHRMSFMVRPLLGQRGS